MYAPADAIRMQKTSQALQQAGYGEIEGAPGHAGVKSKSEEYKKNLDKMIREEKTALEGKIRILGQEESSYKKISDQYQKVIKAGKEDLKIKEQLKTAQETLSKAKEEELDSETKINALLKEKQRFSASGSLAPKNLQELSGAFRGGGFKHGMSQIPGYLGNMTGGTIAGGIGLAGMAMGGLGALGAGAERFTGYGMRLEQAKGSAVAGTAGQDLQGIYGGRSPYEAAWTQKGLRLRA